MAPDLIHQTVNLGQQFDSFFDDHPELRETDYGHAARNLAWGTRGIGEELDEANQKKHLHDSALELVKMFGKQILKHEGLREGLKNALTDDELKQFE